MPPLRNDCTAAARAASVAAAAAVVLAVEGGSAGVFPAALVVLAVLPAVAAAEVARGGTASGSGGAGSTFERPTPGSGATVLWLRAARAPLRQQHHSDDSHDVEPARLVTAATFAASTADTERLRRRSMNDLDAIMMLCSEGRIRSCCAVSMI